MPSPQGDISLLNDPVAQDLLRSHIPARLAYTWTDGTPRVVPIGYHWNGKEFVLCTGPDAPKMEVIRDGTRVALSIDSDRFPWKVLLVRGPVRIDVYQGIAPEYELLSAKMMGEEGARAFTSAMGPVMTEMVRIFLTPDWVSVIDFETRFPPYMQRAMERAGLSDTNAPSGDT